MLALLSPAKTLDFETPAGTETCTQPDFLKFSKFLIGALGKLKPGEIAELMSISPKLADLNHRRFREWQASHDLKSSKQAVLAFKGDVYEGLKAWEFGAKDLAWAQDHLRILSGLYGLLRPLDLIQPHRLEMGTVYANPAGKDLYAFWGERLTDLINDRLADHPDNTVINLASKEYFTAVKPKLLSGAVVTPSFKEIKDGKAKVIGFMAKKARGMMARHIIQNRLENPQDLKSFNAGGYQFQAEQSDDQTWVFTRPSTTA